MKTKNDKSPVESSSNQFLPMAILRYVTGLCATPFVVWMKWRQISYICLMLIAFLYTNSTVSAQDCEDIDKIRILVAYTTAVANAYDDPYTSLIKPAIDNINQSYENSGVNHRVMLARSVQVDYIEKPKLKDSRNDFWYEGPPYSKMDNIHELRVLYNADVCILIVKSGTGGSGIAAGIGVESENAFLAMKASSSVARYTMAHEIGHLYGCRHEKALDTETDPNNYGYGHGYVLDQQDAQGNYLHTIMAYGTDANKGVATNPIPYWSSPNNNYNGEILGTADEADAVRMLNEGYRRLKGWVLASATVFTKDESIEDHEVMDVLAIDQLETTSGKQYVLKDGASGSFRSTGNIKLMPGFHAQPGSKFVAYICEAEEVADECEEVCTCNEDDECICECIVPTSARMESASVEKGQETAGGLPEAQEPEAAAEIWEAPVTRVTVYPNPFSHTTTFAYHVKQQNSRVLLRVYNATGVTVATPVNTQQAAAGSYEILFDGSGLPSGLYLYRLEIGETVEIGKIILKR